MSFVSAGGFRTLLNCVCPRTPPIRLDLCEIAEYVRCWSRELDFPQRRLSVSLEIDKIIGGLSTIDFQIILDYCHRKHDKCSLRLKLKIKAFFHSHLECLSEFVAHDVVKNRVNTSWDVIQYSWNVMDPLIDGPIEFVLLQFIMSSIESHETLSVEWCPANKKCYHYSHCKCRKR